MMAFQMGWHEFENWIAKELYNQPSTADTSELTDKLFLFSGGDSLPLDEIDRKIDELLESETKENLQKWLKNKRL